MYYVLSLGGYECYSPIWFVSKFSKQAFKTAVKKTVKIILDKSLENPEAEGGPSYIDGHTFIGFWKQDVKKMLKDSMKKQGFYLIEPDYELSFEGECLYRECNKKPSIFSKGDWEKILKHNKFVHDYVYKDEEKEGKESY